MNIEKEVKEKIEAAHVAGMLEGMDYLINNLSGSAGSQAGLLANGQLKAEIIKKYYGKKGNTGR